MTMRSIFQNDSVMARHLDGDGDDDDDDDTYGKGTDTDSETLAPSLQERGGTKNGRYNTGPKGVRSDARAFAVSRSTMQDAAKQAEQARLRSIGQAHAWSQETDARERWVEARLKALSKADKTDHHGLERVDADRYLELVESTRQLCVVISRFYDDDDDDDEGEEDDDDDDRRRGRVEDLLDRMSDLFARYGTRAIQLSAAEAEIDPVACPAILQYRNGGELVATHMRVDDLLHSSRREGEIEDGEVEELLLRLGVLGARDREASP